MPDTDGEACPGCQRFWSAVDALVLWTERHRWTRTWVLILGLTTLGVGVGAIIAVAVLT
ncbi:MAG: hypothetical protein HYS45_01115 [Parcubacteria group bacterium]|nr:hypothetical protein [Parcubacteria group bacterium]